MKQLTTFLLLLGFMPALSQKSEVAAVLQRYQINPSLIDSFAVKHIDNYSYDVKNTIVLDGTEKVSVATYDATKPLDERWTLISVNGSSPRQGQINAFRKEHDVHFPTPSPDSTKWKLVKQDAKEIVVSFQYDPATLTKDDDFMADAVITLHFDAANGYLIKSESEIEKSFKIKMLKADYMNSNATYVKPGKEVTFLPKREEISITLRMLGRPVEMITINEYSNFKKAAQ